MDVRDVCDRVFLGTGKGGSVHVQEMSLDLINDSSANLTRGTRADLRHLLSPSGKSCVGGSDWSSGRREVTEVVGFDPEERDQEQDNA